MLSLLTVSLANFSKIQNELVVNGIVSYHDITLLPYSDTLDIFKLWQDREKAKIEQAEREKIEQESSENGYKNDFQSFQPKGLDSFGNAIN